MRFEKHIIYLLNTCPGNTFTRTVDHKVYELNDHLGNVRVVITDVKNSTINGTTNLPENFTVDAEAYMNYYAFGGALPGRAGSSSTYRYGFNGKEEETELHGNSGGAYDYGARIYDARLGRWLSCDPFEAKYPDLSSYNYTANSPILFIDPDGKYITLYSSKDAKDRSEGVRYVPGQEYKGNDKFIAETWAQLDYLILTAVDDEKIVESLANAIDIDWAILKTDKVGPGSANSVANLTEHNPTGGLKTLEGGTQDAATGLLHEAGHIWISYIINRPIPSTSLPTQQDFDRIDMFENEVPGETENNFYKGPWEENFIIRKWENLYAKSRGYAQRYSHDWIGYETAGPLTNEPAPESILFEEKKNCIPCAENATE